MPQSGIRLEPLPDGLAGREVQVVGRRRDESAADPELEQPGSMSTSALRRTADTTSWLRW